MYGFYLEKLLQDSSACQGMTQSMSSGIICTRFYDLTITCRSDRKKTSFNVKLDADNILDNGKCV